MIDAIDNASVQSAMGTQKRKEKEKDAFGGFTKEMKTKQGIHSLREFSKQGKETASPGRERSVCKGSET